MPRLSELNPEWIDYDGRHGLGVSFDCMVGSHHGRPCTIRNWILFTNPLDGGPPWPGNSRTLIAAVFPDGQVAGCGETRWARKGTTFQDLSMSPSVNAGPCGHYTLTNGVWT